jgi:hypothetical protein
MKTAILVVALLLPASVYAQEPIGLKLPTTVVLSASAADWAATAWCQQNWRCEEANPMYSWLNDRGGTPAVIALGATIDVATVWATRRFLGRKHPRLVSAAFYGLAAYRSYLAWENINVGRIDRRLSRPR